jgi:hypothetical protein
VVQLPVGKTADDFERVSKGMEANDDNVVGLMMRAGDVWFVNAGTKCQVVTGGPKRSEVRLLEGPHKGENCVVDADWIASE